MITNRALFVAFLLALAIVMFAVNVRAADGLPAGYTCSDVRENVRKYGYWPALLWARANGFRPSEIEAAKRCLKQ